MTSLTATQTPPHLRGPAPAQRRRRLHLTARGRLLMLLGMALLMLGAFAIGRSASSQATEATAAVPALTQVTVAPGDTLWSVARGVAPQRDPREIVAQIRRLNHLPSASLRVGQQLLLPVVV